MRNVPIDIVSQLKAQCGLSVVNRPFRELPVTKKIFVFISTFLNDRSEIEQLHLDLNGYSMQWPSHRVKMEYSAFKRPMYELMYSNVDLVLEFRDWFFSLKNVIHNSMHDYPQLSPLLDNIKVLPFKLLDDSSVDEAVTYIGLIDTPTVLVIDITNCHSAYLVQSISYAIELNTNIFASFSGIYQLTEPEFNFIDINSVDLLPLVFVNEPYALQEAS